MKRLKIFTWHVHGSYLYYLSQIPHDFYIPKKFNSEEGYAGITPSYPWGPNIHEIGADEVKDYQFDCILFQSHKNYLKDQFEILSSGQRQLPLLYLEHDPPREHATDTLHPVNDPSVMVIHVTDFNNLMWDCRKSATTVIEHGVFVPDDVRYQGHLERGIVVVNNLHKRGRRLGSDIFLEARRELPLDLVGMGWKEMDGLGEMAHSDLPGFCSQYRFFFNPIRYTSLGLSICEAMMTGMPVLGLATTELATVIVNGKSGFISTRTQDLIDAGQELLIQPKLAKELGEGARLVAMERFGIDRFIHDWNQLLQLMTGKIYTRMPKPSKEITWTLQS